VSDVENDEEEVELPEAWFALDGKALYDLLERAFDGEAPDELYMELFDTSDDVPWQESGAPPPPPSNWLGRRKYPS
jgi:hypothetical protein